MNSSVLHKLCDMVSEGLEQGRESDARGIETKLLIYLLRCSRTKIAGGQHTTRSRRSSLDAELDVDSEPCFTYDCQEVES